MENLNYMDAPMMGIYKVTSPIGEVYIGATKDIYKRFRSHKGVYSNTSSKLKESLNTHGSLNHSFDIVHELPKDCDRTTLFEYEKIYIDLYKSCGVKMLNISDGGKGPSGVVVTFSENTKKKLSIALKGNKNGLGITRSPELRERIRQSLLGGKRSDESKEKMRMAKLGKPGVNKGRIQRPEVVLARSLAMKGKVQSEETKAKKSESLKISWANRKNI